MDLEKINILLEGQDGNHAEFYPILKDRLNVYNEYEVAFAGEFLFFEERYLMIKKHMIENNIKTNIVDIGCQFGFQSEIFLDCESYLGIDVSKPSHFMNNEKPNINYQVGLFPDVDIDLVGKTVISSMSLGYFDSWINEDKNKARVRIVNKIKNCDNLYIASEKSLIDDISKYFDNTEILDASNAGDFDLYVLTK